MFLVACCSYHPWALSLAPQSSRVPERALPNLSSLCWFAYVLLRVLFTLLFSVVALLEKLGVFMVVDDRGTNDVHAEEMGGWPPVVTPVLSSTHGGDYEVASLPRNVREGTTSAMGRFLKSMDTKGRAGHTKLVKHAEAKRGKGFVATGVSYGYKAPVSMLLVPFLALAYKDRGFKFLQVGQVCGPVEVAGGLGV